MNFQEAFTILREGGNKITRAGWKSNGVSDAFVEIRISGEVENVYICFDSGEAGKWTPTQTDLFADDWEQFAAAGQTTPKTHCCARRHDYSFPDDGAALEDYWYERDGHQRCSYCGSIHPETFLTLLMDGFELVPTDKNYKAYLHDRKSRHVGKFYFQHFSEEQARRLVDMVNMNQIRFGAPGYFYRLPYFMTLLEKEDPAKAG